MRMEWSKKLIMRKLHIPNQLYLFVFITTYSAPALSACFYYYL